MADFSISITVPDAKVSELVAAMNWAWGYTGEVGSPTAPRTGAQLRDEFKVRSVQALKDIHQRHQQYLREQQALAQAPNIT